MHLHDISKSPPVLAGLSKNDPQTIMRFHAISCGIDMHNNTNASRGSLFNLADGKNQFYRPQRSLM